MKFKNSFKTKKLIVFDLDGTLSESKSRMDGSMSSLLNNLLKNKKVAVISGGRFDQFKKQFLSSLKCPKALLKNLFLFPTTSTSFYRYKNGWKRVYANFLTAREKERISKAFKKSFDEVGYAAPKKVYGRVIEDRGTQITFSALGQDVVDVLGEKGIRMKEEWNRSGWRKKIASALKKKLKSFEVREGGLTSIDVTHKGIDKAYGIRQIKKHLNVPISEMLFVGDAIFPGGNDYAVIKTGVDYVKVSGPVEAKKLIKFLMS